MAERLFSKSADVVDLRLTRPPDHLKPNPLLSRSSHNIQLSSVAVPAAADAGVPVTKPKERRANPQKRKMLSESSVSQEEANANSRASTLFGDISSEALRRLNSMIANFFMMKDGSLSTDINLSRYGLECGQVITNTVVQELCTIQPYLTSLDLTDCVEVTDAGLWSIARHCPLMRHLVLSGCDQVTNVGLRSISLRCSKMESMDFNHCHLLDDISLTVISTGCWTLKKLCLQNCTGITDTGVGKLAKCCAKLEVLDLNGCSGVGEFGDHALKEIGAYCSLLRDLDLSGCRRVDDPGLKSIAVGCPLLERLRASGCECLTKQSLQALVKHNKAMHTLSLRGCRLLDDNDFAVIQGTSMSNTLTNVDFSQCSRLTDKGVAVIVRSLNGKDGPGLSTLALTGCHQLTDFSATIISNFCPKLRSLDLSRCPLLSDETVHTIARKVAQLTTLRLDGNSKISARALISHIGPRGLEFADMAKTWIGYQPKENYEKLMEEKSERNKLTYSILKLQRAIRRKLAYNVYKKKKRQWLINHVVPKIQATMRGFLQRKKYKKVLFRLHKIRCAILIQMWYRRHTAMILKLKMVKARKYLVYKNTMALTIQRVYRGMKGRQGLGDVRNSYANKRLQEARVQAKRELMAIRIQLNVRAMIGRKRAHVLAVAREQLRRRLLLEAAKTRVLQRVMRGMFGRRRAERRREEIRMEKLRWLSARQVQRMVRGLIARKIAMELYLKRQQELRRLAAIEIQRIFRGYRGKVLGAVAKALQILRQRSNEAAVEVQRVFRGLLGRMRAKLRKMTVMKWLVEKNASTNIQRMFRGHKGREAAVVERELLKIESKARPLLALLKVQEDAMSNLSRVIWRMDFQVTSLESELVEIERELSECEKSTNKYTDSIRINKTPQRYLTKYLRVRLRDHFEHEKEVFKVKITELNKKRGEMRELERHVMAVKRELIPLTTGAIADIKKKRTAALRKKVRARDRQISMIQALWRRALVRMGLKDPARDYWVQCYDPEQSEDTYYYNTWTGETTYHMPLAYRYFCVRPEDITVRPSGATEKKAAINAMLTGKPVTKGAAKSSAAPSEETKSGKGKKGKSGKK